MRFILKYVGGFFGTLSERIFVFFVALLLCQAPQFMNLYLNVLGGSKATYEKSVKEIADKAAEIGMSTEESVKDLLKSQSVSGTKSAELHQNQINHLAHTKQAFDAIKNASAIARPFVFIKYVDWTLAKSVQFQPALPVTLEALIYVIVGIILGMLLFRALLYFPRRWLGLNKPTPV